MKTPINWDTHNQDTISFETRSNILNQSTSQNLKLAAYVHHQLWFHLEYPVIWLTEQGCMESIHQDTWRLPSQCRAPSSNRSPILHRTTLWQVWKLEKHEDLDLISNIRSETIFTNLYQSSSSSLKGKIFDVRHFMLRANYANFFCKKSTKWLYK